MIIIQLGQYLFHDCFTEKHRLGPYAELLAVLPDRRHLAVIQIDDLPMLTHKGLLLLLEIFRIDTCRFNFSFSGHLVIEINFAKVNN